MAHIESGSTCKHFKYGIKRHRSLLCMCSGTGNTVIEAVRVLNEHGLQAKHIILLSLFSTPHGETHTVKTSFVFSFSNTLTSVIYPSSLNRC